nr:MAG TPA: hypothetical protein [Caudoviricetes sp.]
MTIFDELMLLHIKYTVNKHLFTLTSLTIIKGYIS